MLTVAALQKEKAGLKDQMKAVMQIAETAGRDMSDDEAAAFDSLSEQAEAINVKIERAQKIENMEREAAAVVDSSAATHTENQLQADADTGIQHVQDNIAKDPMKGFASKAEFFGDVMRVGQNRQAKNPDGMKFLATAGTDEQHTGNDQYGGFLVPEGVAGALLSTTAEEDFMKPFVMSVPMGSPTVPFNARVDKSHSTSVSGGLTVGRNVETQAATSSRMSFEQVTLTASYNTGLAYVSDALLADSPQSFVAILEAGFNEEFANSHINERLNGTGVGEFEGITNNPALVEVAKETSQTADTIVTNNILKMMSRCYKFNQAIWVANQNTLPQIAALVDAGSNSLFIANANDSLPGTLFGRPIFFTEYAQTVGDKNDIMLLNLSQYLEGQYQPLESAESMHVRFENSEKAFRFTERNDGRGWWRSVLTPKNGSTISPFVTLAARA